MATSRPHFVSPSGYHLPPCATREQLPDRPVRRCGGGSGLGAVLAIATPLLPVNQTTAQLNWPQNGTFASVEAPLIGYVG